MAPKTQLSDDDKIIRQAKDEFERCESWEAETRRRFIEDIRFANGDPDNGWQWDTAIQTDREGSKKPCLTINKTRQHNLQITNDAKQNKPGVNIRPVGDSATYDAAQVFEGIVRHIEYQSNAEQAYDTATVFQVQGGIGYWRVVTDYVSDTSFDQEIYIRRVKNPQSVYLDPDITEADGSDARFGFIFEDVENKLFKVQYPDFEDMVVSSNTISPTDNWLSKDYVRVAEYYVREQKRDKLITFIVPPPFASAGQQVVLRKSEMDADIKAVYDGVKDAAKANPGVDAPIERDIVTDEINWYKIAGNQIIERRQWLGKYIPIVRIIGEETVIEGKLDRKGHTRSMKDAQRMYNYWTSEATTQVALQAKTPWLAPAEAIEGLEGYWGASNTDNASVLPYNAVNETGQAIPAPQKQAPPQMASAYIQGMQICQDQMMMTSGQYQSQFGQNENATSGKAINERQRQGDNATYHFIDNLAVGIRFTGKILIDLIPKIYDTERVIRILAKDGTESQIQIKPDAKDAYQKAETPEQDQQKAQKTEKSVAAIFNPNVGRYEVESDIGPGYATRRQEAFNAMTQIAAQNPDFMKIGGDLLWKSADFPLADELADRWSRIIPPNIKGDAPPPEVQQMQGQMQQLQEAVAQLNQKLNDKSQDIEIREYEAATKRLSALGNSDPQISVEQIQPLVMQIIGQMLQGGGMPLPTAPEQQPPVEQQAPDQQLPPMAPAQQPGVM